jgi:uncharacterized membrane protein
MITIQLVLTLLFGAFMVGNGAYHFSNPHTYDPFIPDFLPKLMVNYMTGVAEIVVGISVFIPQLRPYATLTILIMMLAFLPLHIIDIFKEKPNIGTPKMAYQRLALQFLLIFWAWFINK